MCLTAVKREVRYGTSNHHFPIFSRAHRCELWWQFTRGHAFYNSLMKWIDQAAYACAAQWSKCYCVTVSANGIRFIKPIKVGQLVEITASLVHTGASSMHIYVVVKSGDATENTTSVANRCIILLWRWTARVTRSMCLLTFPRMNGICSWIYTNPHR
ncbi:hypothetical protein ALT721_870015 [Alteromonas alvinellae]